MQMRTNSKFSFRKVSQLEVMKQLKSIKRSIANLPPNMLKDAAFVVAAPSTYVISLSLETNLFPTESKAAKIISVHKSGMH